MINKLNIICGYKDGRSYLKDTTYFTRPFLVMNISENKTDPSLYLMVMNSSPGILDEDEHDIEMVLETNCRVLLQSQSYQRLYQMKKGAYQQQRIVLQSGSTFSYVQHPTVPHNGSIFKAHTTIEIADDCSLTFGEIITCGRKHSGEVFMFTRFHSLIEIFYNGKLLLKDNVLFQPQLLALNTIGQLEMYTHQASLFYVQTTPRNMEELTDKLDGLLQTEVGLDYGISTPSPCCIVIRILGNGAEQLLNCLQKVQQFLWNERKTSVAINAIPLYKSNLGVLSKALPV